MNNIPVIVSSASGVEHGAEKIMKMLGTGFHYFITETRNDIAAFTRESISEKDAFFVVASGDTGIDEAVEMIMQYANPSTRIAMGIFSKGSAENVKTNMGLDDRHRVAGILRGIADGKQNLDDYVRLADVFRAGYDEGKTYHTISSFNIGIASEVCHEAEDNGKRFPENLFKKNRMKIAAYAMSAIRSALNPKPITAELSYTMIGGEEKKVMLEDLLLVNAVNGRKHAAARNWNPHGNPFDGKMEFSAFKSMSIFKMIGLVGMMAFTSGSFIAPGKNGLKYNSHGIAYQDRVKSLGIRILDKGKNDCLYIELGGKARLIEKPEAAITLELVPKAVKIIGPYNP
jgi:diacylglycerol kinase family enzyme